MVYQPPVGARDLLPIDVAQKLWIEDRLQQVFHRWGYHRIITSTLERLDTLMAGEAIQRTTVLQLQGMEEEELGLRPELTASIARAAVTRMAGATYPLRLYYNANVFRRAQETSHNRQQEFYQAGVELLGVGGLLADAEILLLLVDCLQSLGLEHCSIILGEAGLTRSLLSPFPAALQPKVRHAIAHLDRVTLETMPLSPGLRDRALLLLDLRGQPTNVLQRVAKFDLDDSQRDALNNLKSLIELLQGTPRTDAINPRRDAIKSPADTLRERISTPSPIPLVLDLSLIQTLDYYTGIVFEVVSESPGGVQVLGQGGRYDQLLGLYHPEGQSDPGIGFALQLEHLHQVLAPTGQLPQQAPVTDWLVVPENLQAYPDALAHAQQLRTSTNLISVELDLGERTAAEIHDYVRHRRITQIAWVKAGGAVVVETVSQQ
ncbi:MAG: ATP phosphoribosyltransferase regulatory subunit [Leptolyngbyaceae cyanobacterium RU_5_1]|nr:ATP phosphoribosyltransferase regulatory subunit [Leptolyngbyaceae cyanobacterium RU_5_1]